MKLTEIERQILTFLPEPETNEEKNHYVRRCVSQVAPVGYPRTQVAVQVAAVAGIKWQSIEVKELIKKVNGGDINSLQQAVALLLQDRYIV